MEIVVFFQEIIIIDMINTFNFKLLSKDKNARLGKLETAHGEIDTPIFMTVGTAATVKAMHLRDIKASGAQIILANTYHLMLRPGQKNVKKMGGVRKFIVHITYYYLLKKYNNLHKKKIYIFVRLHVDIF